MLNHQQGLDAQRSDLARERVELAGERGKVEAATAREAAMDPHLAELNRQLDVRGLAMDRQRTEQRDLDQRKRERDDAIAGRDEARHAQRDAEIARDKAQVDAQAANVSVAAAKEALQNLQAETGRLGTDEIGTAGLTLTDCNTTNNPRMQRGANRKMTARVQIPRRSRRCRAVMRRAISLTRRSGSGTQPATQQPARRPT